MIDAGIGPALEEASRQSNVPRKTNVQLLEEWLKEVS
jgi:hypothetical protein